VRAGFFVISREYYANGRCALNIDNPQSPGLMSHDTGPPLQQTLARLAQSVERETLNLKVAGSTPASGSIPGVVFSKTEPAFWNFFFMWITGVCPNNVIADGGFNDADKCWEVEEVVIKKSRESNDLGLNMTLEPALRPAIPAYRSRDGKKALIPFKAGHNWSSRKQDGKHKVPNLILFVLGPFQQLAAQHLTNDSPGPELAHPRGSTA
jgi:hypothetical protein